MMSICIDCGNVKKRPIDTCRVCGFRPRTPDEKARSVILSTFYEIDGEYRGKRPEELRALATSVAAGHFRFDPDEVQQVAAYGEAVAGITAHELTIDSIKWVGPPLLLLLAFLILIWLGR